MRRHSLAVVRGDSMLPVLHDGDLLVVRRKKPPKVGDLAVVRMPRAPGATQSVVAVKRVTGREAGGWWVERENPRVGIDSWHVGAVADVDVLGVVRARLWPSPGRLRTR